MIAFTGPASAHAEDIQAALTDRYGINISFGTSSTFGELTGFASMKKYSKRKTQTVELMPSRPSRRIVFDKWSGDALPIHARAWPASGGGQLPLE